MKERSIIRFEQGIKSRQTLNNYRDHLKNFKAFANFDDYDSLITKPVEQIQGIVEDYLIHIKENRHPNSVPILMLGVRHFFVMNRIPLYWDIIRKMYPPRKKSAGFKPWTTQQIQQMLLATTSKRNRALVHFLSSTGARVGVIDENFTIKYLENISDGCKAVLLYPDENEEYWAFLTPEASKSLDEYQKIISISIAEGVLPATNAIVTLKISALDGNKTELDFSGTAEPKGISEEDLRNNFLPVFKITAEGLEKLHSN